MLGTERESISLTTDIRAQSVIELVSAAILSDEPTYRAEMLAEAQRQIGWTLRSAVTECQDAEVAWRNLASVSGMAHDRLFRQYSAGGPIVTGAAYYRVGTRNDHPAPLLAVGFRTVDDGLLHLIGEDDLPQLDSFEMPFNPGGPSPYRG